MLWHRGMKIIAARVAWLALTVSLLGVISARAEEGAEPVPSGSCNRTASLEAAKNALARGDRAHALEHLRIAETLLEACARSSDRTAPQQELDDGEPAVALREAPSIAFRLS